MSATGNILRPVTAENEDEMKFALSTLISSLNGIEKMLVTLPEGASREMLGCWHGLAEQAVGVLFRPEPGDAKTPHHPNGSNGVQHADGNGNGRGLNAAQLDALARGRKNGNTKKQRCECGRVIKGGGPMARHRAMCASAQKAKKGE